MKIIFTKNFLNKLDKQIKYISKDKPKAAEDFRENLIFEIEKIPLNPLSYTKSRFFVDENIRELIFKGYRIVFEIRKKEIISIFGFHKWERKLRN
ncbi:type II toxin-antitoxin system RelE/ParE family toxin [Halpernia sp.]|uniref:type II toxin-antitoxin system RelE/ParE family toxin n=1 Tax=Halpernia sp. TaxID=2782209 RepID=UPI003A8E5B92